MAGIELMGMAEPAGEWYERRKRNPKGMGEVSQAAFLLRARGMGLAVAIPWGDSERCDFVVWAKSGRMRRVQVKGTGRLYRRGYEVQAVSTTRDGRKKRYTAREIDVLAAYVQPVEAWYLVPIAAVGRRKSLRLYPGIASKSAEWERWLEAWEELE